MRYSPLFNLSTRLVIFVSFIVLSVILILSIGGVLSFQRMAQEYQTQFLQRMSIVVDDALTHNTDEYGVPVWLPSVLQASNIVEMQLDDSSGTIYQFVNHAIQIENKQLLRIHLPLAHHAEHQLTVKYVPLYLGYGYSLEVMSALSIAVAVIFFGVLWGMKWLKAQVIGVELLEERGRMILAGRMNHYTKGQTGEVPESTSLALDKLIEELLDARQERSRFDTFIRTQTFLDQLTGTANRILFDSKLESALLEPNAQGYLFMLGLEDMELVLEKQGKEAVNEWLISVGTVLSNMVAGYPDVVLSRYYEHSFLFLIPHQNKKEAEKLASQCLRLLEKMPTPKALDSYNWCHLGLTAYQEGERSGRLLNEVETALKSARLQGVNHWSSFNKQARIDADSLGRVRWQALFDRILTPETIELYYQPCYLFVNSTQRHCIHYELFVRLYDPKQGILKASHFKLALENIGYESALDRALITRVLAEIKKAPPQLAYSLNLHVTPFLDKYYVRWFRNELMQLPLRLRKALSFELPESALVQQLDAMRPIIKMMSGLGCEVVIGQAGRTIVATHYIKELAVDHLKLHRGLIKNIDQRHENQLFIRSLLGVCGGTNTKVIAVGVENDLEWQTLLALGIHGGQGRWFDEEQPLFLSKQSFLARKVQPGKRSRWRAK